MNGRSPRSWLSARGTLQAATNCFITALNRSTGKQTVVDSRLVFLTVVVTSGSFHVLQPEETLIY